MRIATDWKKRARETGILLAIGSFLAFIDPFGATTNLPFWGTWLFWTGLILWGSTAGEFSTWAFRRVFPNAHPFLLWLGVSFLTALFVTPALIAVQAALGYAPSFSYLWQLFIGVLIISAAMTALGMLLHRAFKSGPGPAIEPDTPGDAAFRERLPFAFRKADIYAVSSEDHYLRVHTSAGETLILMRLADAIKELESVDGLQTHRSWWVAKRGLEDARRENGRAKLVLKSGMEAPVSRTYAKAVKAAGWH